MRNIQAVSAPRKALCGSSRAAMVELCAAFAVLTQISPGHAGNYTASNEAELRNAIDAANGDGDPNATITLTANIPISNPAAFPAFAKPTTINTGVFILSGVDIASGPSSGGSLTFAGGALLTVTGTVRGGSADQTVTTGVRGTGGTRTVLTNRAMSNQGSVSGGIGAASSVKTRGMAGGAGATLTNSTLTNQGTITGGGRPERCGREQRLRL